MADDVTWGSGIGLTDDFDLALNEYGDVAVFTEFDELQKDLAYMTGIRLQDSLGLPMTAENQARIRIRTRNILLLDPRVEEVESVEVVDDGDTVHVDVTIISRQGQTYNLSVQ